MKKIILMLSNWDSSNPSILNSYDAIDNDFLCYLEAPTAKVLSRPSGAGKEDNIVERENLQ